MNREPENDQKNTMLSAMNYVLNLAYNSQNLELLFGVEARVAVTIWKLATNIAYCTIVDLFR